jgi:hypothetical protein
MADRKIARVYTDNWWSLSIPRYQPSEAVKAVSRKFAQLMYGDFETAKRHQHLHRPALAAGRGAGVRDGQT